MNLVATQVILAVGGQSKMVNTMSYEHDAFPHRKLKHSLMGHKT